jgi:hypothetical protein
MCKVVSNVYPGDYIYKYVDIGVFAYIARYILAPRYRRSKEISEKSPANSQHCKEISVPSGDLYGLTRYLHAVEICML